MCCVTNSVVLRFHLAPKTVILLPRLSQFVDEHLLKLSPVLHMCPIQLEYAVSTRTPPKSITRVASQRTASVRRFMDGKHPTKSYPRGHAARAGSIARSRRRLMVSSSDHRYCSRGAGGSCQYIYRNYPDGRQQRQEIERHKAWYGVCAPGILPTGQFTRSFN